MSSKSKETMQKETMRYLSSDLNLFQEFLFGSTDQTKMDSDKPIIEPSHDHSGKIEKTTSSEGNDATMVRQEGSVARQVTSVPKKRRRSKYENVDFSHIYREPKTSKYNKTSVQQENVHNQAISSQTTPDQDSVSKYNDVTKQDNLEFIRNLFNMIFDSKTTEDECNGGNHETEMSSNVSRKVSLSNDDTGGSSMGLKDKLDICSSSHTHMRSSLPADSKEIDVRSLVDILIHSKSKAHQDKVLDVLRSNETVRLSFLKEVSGLRGIRIPLFNNSASLNLQNAATNRGCDANSTTELNNTKLDDNLASQQTPSSTADESVQTEPFRVYSTNHKVPKENNDAPPDTRQTDLHPSLYWLQDQGAASLGPLVGTSGTCTNNAHQVETDKQASYIFVPEFHSASMEGATTSGLFNNEGLSNSGCDEIHDLDSQLYLSNNPTILFDNQGVTE